MANTFVELDVNAVNSLLISFIRSVAGYPESRVLVENRTGPRPADYGAYVTLLWLEQEMLNQFDSFTELPAGDDEGVEELKNESRCTVRITVRGDDAYNRASELRYHLDSGNRAFDLWDILGFSGVSSVMDLSAAYGGKIQQRAHIDLSFYAAFGRRYDLSWFSSVPWIINGLRAILPIEEFPPCPKRR